jgi:hypothetical protein
MRWFASHALFVVGDLLSKPMMAFDWGWIYPAYNRLMGWSSEIQGDSERGPWSKP